MLAIAVLNLYHCSKQTKRPRSKQTPQQTVSRNKNWVKLVNKLNKVKINRKVFHFRSKKGGDNFCNL